MRNAPAPFFQHPPYPLYNDSGEEMPGFSIAQIKAAASQTQNGQRLAVVTKPDGGSPASYVLTSPQAISDKAKGAGVNTFAGGWVKYDAYASEEPAVGDEVGPLTNSWEVGTDGSGLLVWIVDTDNTLVYVHALGGGGGGLYYVTIVELLDSENCNCLIASATVDRVPCSGARASVGDTITIFDDLECDLNTAPAAEWVGVRAIVVESKGDATTVSPLDPYCDPDGDGDYSDLDYSACHYSIVRVCCP